MLEGFKVVQIDIVSVILTVVQNRQSDAIVADVKAGEIVAYLRPSSPSEFVAAAKLEAGTSKLMGHTNNIGWI